jgi:manganese/zinc/iron transport system permease protein
MIAELWFDPALDTWSVILAILIGTSCGLLGTVFLLRRAALLGDAVSHSVLPGIAVGLIIAGAISAGRSPEEGGWDPTALLIFVGALGAGLASAAFVEALSRMTRIKPDAALGAVFPAFFAAGVLLLDLFARGSHIDVACVFFGSLESIRSMRQVVPTLVTTIAVIAFFAVFYKEILATSFDPLFARTTGLHHRFISSALVVLLTAIVVSAFEAVGAVLVIAFLVVPPASAYLLSDRFGWVLVLAALLGVTAGVGGCWMTIVLENAGIGTARASTMALFACGQFAIALLFAPRRGLIRRSIDQRALSRRILDENIIAALYRLSRDSRGVRVSSEQSPVKIEHVADYLGKPLAGLRRALRRQVRVGRIETSSDGTLTLTDDGVHHVVGIVRAHRLWESYMSQELGLPADHVHASADEVEHFLGPHLIDEIAERLERPDRDPHGRDIPWEPSLEPR